MLWSMGTLAYPRSRRQQYIRTCVARDLKSEVCPRCLCLSRYGTFAAEPPTGETYQHTGQDEPGGCNASKCWNLYEYDRPEQRPEDETKQVTLVASLRCEVNRIRSRRSSSPYERSEEIPYVRRVTEVPGHTDIQPHYAQPHNLHDDLSSSFFHFSPRENL